MEQSEKKHFMTPISRWLPAFVIMAVIFFLSSRSTSALPDFGFWDLLIKKGGHLIGYLLLGLAYRRAIYEGKRGEWITAVVMALLYAMTDELHQMYTPGRNPSLVDVGIDLSGALMGQWLFHHWGVIKRIVLTGSR